MSQFTINQKELLDPEDYSIQRNEGAYIALAAVSNALKRRFQEACSAELEDFITEMEQELFNCRMYLNNQVVSIIDTMEQEVAK